MSRRRPKLQVDPHYVPAVQRRAERLARIARLENELGHKIIRSSHRPVSVHVPRCHWCHEPVHVSQLHCYTASYRIDENRMLACDRVVWHLECPMPP